MNSVFVFSLLVIVHGMLFFFDRFFKSCMHYQYDAFLRKIGLSVQFMGLHWHTAAFNRQLVRWSSSGHSWCKSILTKAYTIGVLLALSLLPIGTVLLTVTIFSGHTESASTAHAGAGATQTAAAATGAGVSMEILLPGVNLPLSEIGYYVVTLLISTLVHEIGHAVAAILEDVPVTGFGLKVYFCLPLAYTELSNEHLNELKWFRKLRIICAGIFHNIFLALICYFLISTLSITMAPFYSYNKNIIVAELTPRSPLRSLADSPESGLQVGDVITDINGCQITNEDSWRSCLLKTIRQAPGYCVSSDFIRLNDESIDVSHHSPDNALQCCDARNPRQSCFEHIDDTSNDAPVEIPQYLCLDVRQTLENAFGQCDAQRTCNMGFCLQPLLHNTTAIFNIKHESRQQKSLPNVVYIGHPLHILRTVRISPFVPKQSVISSDWPDAYTLLLKYVVVFSFGLAVINAMPCIGLDGAHITSTIVHSFLAKRVPEFAKREFIALLVNSLGSMLFAIALIKVMWHSFVRHYF